MHQIAIVKNTIFDPSFACMYSYHEHANDHIVLAL